MNITMLLWQFRKAGASVSDFGSEEETKRKRRDEKGRKGTMTKRDHDATRHGSWFVDQFRKSIVLTVDSTVESNIGYWRSRIED